MWNDLTQNQKADLMDIYLKNGITSIKQMQQHYNSNLYADGGNLEFIKYEDGYVYIKL